MNREPRYPGEAAGVLRISQSSLETYLRCGLLYEWQREEPGVRYATIAMVVGSAVAAGAHADNEQKINHGKGAPLADLVDTAVAAYEDELEDSDVDAAAIEVDRGKDETANASRVYWQEVSPQIQNVAYAEEPIVAEIDDRIELAGRPDCITEGGIVRDTKTGQPWTQARVDESRQLTGYDLLHEARTGLPTRRVAIDSISKTPRGWESKTLWSSRTEDDRQAFLTVVRAAKRAMDAGVVLPAPEAAWWCSATWCPRWRRGCPAVNAIGRR